MIDFQLNNPLENVNFNLYGDNFVFKFKDTEYKCNPILGDILSPIISKNHQSDIMYSEFSFDLEDPNHYFQDILNLAQGDSITINDKNKEFFQKVAFILNNKELSEICFGEVDELTIYNIFDHIQLRKLQNLRYSKELKFIAANLYQIPISKLEKFSLADLDIIFSSNDLKLSSEEELFDFIYELSIKDKKFTSLFEYVYFEFIDSKRVKLFMDLIEDNSLNYSMWKSLTRRLQLPLSESPYVPSRYLCSSSGHLVEDDGHHHGIFSYLNGKYIKFTSAVSCSSSSKLVGNVENILIMSGNSAFQTKNLPNQWIKVFFKCGAVKVSSYQIRSYNYDANQHHHLKSWVLEGSNDDISWVQIDEHIDDDSLNGRLKVGTYHVNNNSVFRYIRLRQIGKTWANKDYLLLTGFELFGTVFTNEISAASVQS